MNTAVPNLNTLAGRAAPLPNRGPGDINGPLQKFAKHQTNVFDTLRGSIKLNGNMFAFGKPTAEIVELMSRIYHENILRMLSDLPDVDGKAQQYDDAGLRKDRLKCMFGIMQDTDNNLYVTISESPGFDDIADSATDIDFMNKRQMMFNLLKSANVKYKFLEERAFPESPIPASMRWRKGIRDSESWDRIDNIAAIRQKIKDNNLKEIMFFDSQWLEDNENIYAAPIRTRLNVNWIDSIEYLRNRKTSPTFKPFKKYKLSKNKTTWQAECNNGHLCTESKLFAYAAQNGIKVKSFVAYWIGAFLPPENHILRSYSYRTKEDEEEKRGLTEKDLVDYTNIINKEKGLLIRLARDCYGLVLDRAPYKEIHSVNPKKFLDKFQHIVQPSAVACPGCFANIQAYKNGKMNIWDMSNCYSPRRAIALGGSRKNNHTTKRNRKQLRRTRKQRYF